MSQAPTPARGHAITIRPNPDPVTVRLGDAVVARTSRALMLTEGSSKPVLYIPREDADMAAFEPSPRRTTCPFKGEASYFSLSAGGRRADNAVWSYETPKAEVASIAGHLAFYPDTVTIEAG